MKFDAILQYQETDIKLRKIYDEIEKSKLNVSLENARAEFNNAKAKVADSEKAAEVLVNLVNNAERLYAEGIKAFEDIEAKLNDTESDEERAECLSKLENIRRKLGEIEKKLSEVKPRADRTIKDYRTGQETGKKMREEYNKAKEALETLKKSKEPAVDELKKKLNELSAHIEPAIMEQYNALKADGKYVAFVEALPRERGTVYCRGCGIELPQKLKSELNETGMCRCEKCRRIIYKKQ